MPEINLVGCPLASAAKVPGEQAAWRCRCRGAAWILAVLLAAGCGGRGMGQVKGRVTVGGVPVAGGTIMFYPADGPGAVGQIAADGTYTLSTHKPDDGAVVGSHKVAIHATSVGPGTLQEPKTLEDELRGSAANSTGKILVPGKVIWLVPEKYSTPDHSPLTAEVQAGQNTIDFDIPKP